MARCSGRLHQAVASSSLQNRDWVLLLLCLLLSVQLSTSQWTRCNPLSGDVVAPGVNGLMVNLTVTCDQERDVANLDYSTGGLQVRSLRGAQECTVLDNETISEVDEIVSVSASRSRQELNVPLSPLFSQHLQDSDIECRYFGCYYSDKDAYDSNYIFIFPNVTCTFSQANIMPTSSSSRSQTRLFSAQISSSSHDLSTFVESSSLADIPPSTLVLIITRESLVSTAVVSHQNTTDASLPPENTESDQLPWVIFAVFIAVMTVLVTVITCLIFSTKRFLNTSVKRNIYGSNEPFDMQYTPVHFSSLTPAFSDFSITTKLDKLCESDLTEKVDLGRFDPFLQLLDPPMANESAELNFGLEPPTDPNNTDVQIVESMTRNAPSNLDYVHIPSTNTVPMVNGNVPNGFTLDQHQSYEISTGFNLDSGSDNSSGLTEPMDDNFGKLGNASTPLDLHNLDASQLISDSNLHSDLHIIDLQEDVTDELDYDLDTNNDDIMTIQLDNHPEHRLKDTRGYVLGDQLGHVHLQQQEKLYCEEDVSNFEQLDDGLNNNINNRQYADYVTQY